MCAACTTPVGPSKSPELLWRANAYSGPLRLESEVATVYALDGRPSYEASYICAAAGFRLERGGECASVVYLLPGEHAVAMSYASPRETGNGTARIRVEAGRTYLLNFTSLRTLNMGLIQLMPMPVGQRLTFRNLAPGLSAGLQRIDEPVPYGPNRPDR